MINLKLHLPASLALFGWIKVCNISKIPETSEKAVGCLVIPVVMVDLKELDFGVYILRSSFTFTYIFIK